MEVVYGIISYHAHTRSAQYYAEQALTILQAVEAEAPAALPTFLSANSVLTLSGVRAYDAFHAFYDNVHERDASKVALILLDNGIYLQYSANLFSSIRDPKFRTFELLNETAFHDLWQQYEFPQDVNLKNLSLHFLCDAIHTAAWMGVAESELASSMENNVLPRVWLNDWYAPMNVRFGMMLGYPAKAIESELWSEIGLQHEETAYAKIRHHDAYFAAQPIYSFSKSLAEDSEIVTHQTLWSGVLDAVYESSWHKQLKQSEFFVNSLNALKQFEN